MKKNKITTIDKDVIIELLKTTSITSAANILNVHTNSIHRFVRKHKVSYNKEVSLQQMRAGGTIGGQWVKDNMNMAGENNPNWKNGISKNRYHYKKIQEARYPDRVKARKNVYVAVKKGKLVKQPCEVCGCHNSFAHHDDYSKPLEVRWLCRPHHRGLHDHKH